MGGLAPTLFLISPFMRNGKVMAYLRANPSVNRVRLLGQIAEGLAHLHTRIGPKGVVVHGDLKGENILISDDGNAFIADFGFSTCIDEDIQQRTGATTTSFQMAGTLPFMAPEILLLGEQKSPATDVYAFGMVIYQLHEGSPPFREMNAAQLIVAIHQEIRPKLPSRFDNAPLWALATKCWSHNAADRPTMEEVAGKLRVDL